MIKPELTKNLLAKVFCFCVLCSPVKLLLRVSTTIATIGLNFSVRNGKRCDPNAKTGEQNTQMYSVRLLKFESNTYCI